MDEKIDLNEFIKKIENKPIILFGAASRGKRVLNNLLEKGTKKQHILFCDNDPLKWGKQVYGVNILSLNELIAMPKEICIIVSSTMYYEIINQLRDLGFTNVNYFHSLLHAEKFYEKYSEKFLQILGYVRDKCYMDTEEMYTIYSSLMAVRALSGDVAELGVYKGGSAKLMCELKEGKNLYLFDTFEGLPTDSNIDQAKKGWHNDTSLEDVKKYLDKYDGVYFFKGFFPQTATSVDDKLFSFVHLDTDMYQSTLDALNFFWPRMVQNGRIVSHDYNTDNIPGIKKAFNEFFKNNPEKIIEIADTQVMVIK